MAATYGSSPEGDVIDADSLQSWAMASHPAEGGPARAFDVLFLHGMAAGSWIWTDAWLSRFARAGYRSWTMTLPGRAAGGTLGSDPAALDRIAAAVFDGGTQEAIADAVLAALPGAPLFDGPDLDDYTDALSEAIASIERPTVLVGHSLGGAVIQNLLRRGRRPAGAVLLCSAPPYGLWRASMEMAITNLPLWKALFDFSVFGMQAVDLDVMRRNLLPSGIDPAVFASLVGRMTDDSLAAAARTAGFPPFAPLPGAQHKVLVVGGGRDRLVPPLDVYLTGLYYAVRPHIVPEAGHMAMFEPHANQQTAQVILDWLDGQVCA